MSIISSRWVHICQQYDNPIVINGLQYHYQKVMFYHPFLQTERCNSAPQQKRSYLLIPAHPSLGFNISSSCQISPMGGPELDRGRDDGPLPITPREGISTHPPSLPPNNWGCFSSGSNVTDVFVLGASSLFITRREWYRKWKMTKWGEIDELGVTFLLLGMKVIEVCDDEFDLGFS